MIIAYEQNETSFNHNGVAVLDDVLSSKPKIVEELNGTYNFECSITIRNNNKHNRIKKDMIIKADDNYFRIRESNKTFNSVYIFAKQIFFDNEYNFLEDVRPTNLSGAGALSWIFSHTQYSHDFTPLSDIQAAGTAYYTRKDVVAAVMSEANSFLKTWGGEMELDKFIVKILQRRGLDRGVVIRYGKNLIGIEETMDLYGTYTRIMPVGYDENNNPVLLPEKYVDSQYINNYPFPRILAKEFNDIKVDQENNVTLEDVYTKLREEVAKLYESGIDLPFFNYKVNFKDLRDTDEYKDFAVLERVYMGDTVTIKHERIGIDLKARVIKTTKEYNAAKRKWQYKEIELGQFKPDIITQSKSDLSDVKNYIEIQKSDYEKAIENATNLITGSNGGNVVIRRDANGQPCEILVMDTTDIMTAQNVWRLNLGGFGHSSTGINGPYNTAITQDGKIVAAFIYGLVISGEQITTGYITSTDGKISIGIDSGTGIEITGGAFRLTNGNNTVVIDGEHNIFKIVLEGTAVIDFVGESITKPVRHGLGYNPAYDAYQMGANGLNQFGKLPADTFASNGIAGVIRSRVDSEYIYFDFQKFDGFTIPNTTIYVKYYLFKEVCF